MYRKTYEKFTERELLGRRVVSLRILRNGRFRFPAGMTFTIQRKWKGFELLTDPCPHCGIQASISEVPPEDVDFTDQQSSWPGPVERE